MNSVTELIMLIFFFVLSILISNILINIVYFRYISSPIFYFSESSDYLVISGSFSQPIKIEGVCVNGCYYPFNRQTTSFFTSIYIPYTITTIIVNVFYCTDGIPTLTTWYV